MNTQGAYAHLQQKAREAGLLYDGVTPIPVTPTPLVIGASRFQALRDDLESIHGVIERVIGLVLRDRALRSLFPELRPLAGVPFIAPTYSPLVRLARYDLAIGADGQFKLLETNSDCPGGIAYAATARQLVSAGDWAAGTRDRLRPFDESGAFVRSLIGDARRSGGGAVGFLWSHNRPLKNDLAQLCALTETLGHRALVAPIEDISIRGGRAHIGSEELGVGFLKLDAYPGARGDLVWCAGEDPCQFAARVSAALTTVSSFPSIFIGESKKILALLWHPTIQSHFTARELAVVRRVVPRTATVGPPHFGSREIRRMADQERRRCVLKTPLDTRGRGVVLGEACSPAEWNRQLRDARRRGQVVQEYVPLRREYIVVPGDRAEEMYCDLAVFLVDGKVEGLMGRASRSAIVNVGRGGFLRAAFAEVSEALEANESDHR